MVTALTSTPRSHEGEAPGQRGTCAHCGAAPATSSAERLSVCGACGWLVARGAELSEHAAVPVWLNVPVELPPGLVLRDRYRIVMPLGQGAHGVTYLARHTYLKFYRLYED